MIILGGDDRYRRFWTTICLFDWVIGLPLEGENFTIDLLSQLENRPSFPAASGSVNSPDPGNEGHLPSSSFDLAFDRLSPFNELQTSPNSPSGKAFYAIDEIRSSTWLLASQRDLGKSFSLRNQDGLAFGIRRKSCLSDDQEESLMNDQQDQNPRHTIAPTHKILKTSERDDVAHSRIKFKTMVSDQPQNPLPQNGQLTTSDSSSLSLTKPSNSPSNSAVHFTHSKVSLTDIESEKQLTLPCGTNQRALPHSPGSMSNPENSLPVQSVSSHQSLIPVVATGASRPQSPVVISNPVKVSENMVFKQIFENQQQKATECKKRLLEFIRAKKLTLQPSKEFIGSLIDHCFRKVNGDANLSQMTKNYFHLFLTPKEELTKELTLQLGPSPDHFKSVTIVKKILFKYCFSRSAFFQNTILAHRKDFGEYIDIVLQQEGLQYFKNLGLADEYALWIDSLPNMLKKISRVSFSRSKPNYLHANISIVAQTTNRLMALIGTSYQIFTPHANNSDRRGEQAMKDLFVNLTRLWRSAAQLNPTMDGFYPKALHHPGSSRLNHPETIYEVFAILSSNIAESPRMMSLEEVIYEQWISEQSNTIIGQALQSETPKMAPLLLFLKDYLLLAHLEKAR